jgi:hypothetical protein
MSPDDRIDNALRAIAQADASRGFSDQVRSRIEAGDEAPVVWWPRLAAASAVLALVASFVWAPREVPAPSSEVPAQSSGVATKAVRTAPLPSAATPRLELPVQRRDVHGRHHVSAARGAVARVETATAVIGDHERALEPLSPLDAISLASVAPDAMAMVDHAIVPLAPIAPLLVHDMLADAKEGEL